MRRVCAAGSALRSACAAALRGATAALEGSERRQHSTCLLAAVRTLAAASPADVAVRAVRADARRLRGQLRRWSSTLPEAQSGAMSAALHTRLVEMRTRHDELSESLGSDPPLSLERIIAINKELTQLSPVVDAFEALRKLEQEIATLEDIAASAGDDAEMRLLAEEERDALAQRLPEDAEALALMLVPTDEADSRDVILEVRAGAGGDEASLFAMDLLRMYERYAARQPGWRFELLSVAAGPAGEGAKEASAAVSGPGAFGRLKHEIGVHRVQRVPATETQGRVHTSTASVAVLPQASAVDVVLRDEDIRIETYRSSGAGGQHVNTTDSAVRVTHVPTGVVVCIQDERSQHKNKAKALKVLRARIFDAARAAAALSRAAERREQIGTADRSERIRTYNFGQGRIKDHRVGVTVNDCDGVMQGLRLDEFIDALAAAERAARLAAMQGGTPPLPRRRTADDDE